LSLGLSFAFDSIFRRPTVGQTLPEALSTPHPGQNVAHDELLSLIHLNLLPVPPRASKGPSLKWFGTRPLARKGDNSMPATEGHRRNIRMLWLGGGVYLFTLLNGLRYFGQLPYQIVILGACLNVAILATFATTLVKIYKRARNSAQTAALRETAEATTDPKTRNLRALWTAAGLYFIAMLIALPRVAKLPYQLSVLAAVLNMAIVLTFVVKLRKAYIPSRQPFNR
jgi:hypothetical protein